MRLIAASHEMQFRNFVSYLALRTTQQVNYQVFLENLASMLIRLRDGFPF